MSQENEKTAPATVPKHSWMSPEQQAEQEILLMWAEHSKGTDFMDGGPTPPETQAEQARHNADFEQKKLAIIVKYGVIKHYATPLLKQIADFKAGLRIAWNEMRAFQIVCKHPEIKGCVCAHCGLEIKPPIKTQ